MAGVEHEGREDQRQGDRDERGDDAQDGVHRDRGRQASHHRDRQSQQVVGELRDQHAQDEGTHDQRERPPRAAQRHGAAGRREHERGTGPQDVRGTHAEPGGHYTQYRERAGVGQQRRACPVDRRPSLGPGGAAHTTAVQQELRQESAEECEGEQHDVDEPRSRVPGVRTGKEPLGAARQPAREHRDHDAQQGGGRGGDDLAGLDPPGPAGPPRQRGGRQQQGERPDLHDQGVEGHPPARQDVDVVGDAFLSPTSGALVTSVATWVVRSVRACATPGPMRSTRSRGCGRRNRPRTPRSRGPTSPCRATPGCPCPS